MNPDEKELYEKTMARLRRIGCRNTEEQIICLAQEIERYRARIQGLMQTNAQDNRPGPDMTIKVFTAQYYTDLDTQMPEHSKNRRAQETIAKQLALLLEANGAIEYTQNREKHLPYCTEHTGAVCVVMPNREEATRLRNGDGLRWIDDHGASKCPVCGYSCNDEYYLGKGNFCPDCGTRLLGFMEVNL